MAKAQLKYRYGGARGRQRSLYEDESLLVVRTKSRRPLERSPLTKPARVLLGSFETIVEFEDAGVEVLRTRTSRSRRALRDEARRTLPQADDIEFAGRVLTERGAGIPVIYTENLFVKFTDGVTASAAKRRLRDAGLKIKREVPYARGAYFVEAPDAGREVFAIADRLLKDKIVELCHPELIRPRVRRVAAPQQWHLKKTTVNGKVINQHANVVAAWDLTEGESVTIAVIDDGVDVDHLDFAGAGKVVHPRDVTRDVDDARPFFSSDRHGTACAGVACASGQHGASGVAPKAKLMPIRLRSNALGSQDEGDAFFWAAQHGADVISCSWGPTDGEWWNPDDPQHNVQVDLPDSTRLAIDWAIDNGRNGKGCVITWAAGNGNESVDNDGYASYQRVIAVAACSDRGKRSVYSDTGSALWCAFPSSDFTTPELTPGIWTTDRSGGAGYNPGAPNANGDAAGNYTQDFGGTSSACPGAAGVAALVIARNNQLRWDEVKDILKDSCRKIDAGGSQYDASGHSRNYGYGRLDAAKAVALAVPPTPAYSVLHEARQDVPIADHKTSRLRVAVGDTKAISGVKIHVDLEHTYIGDLVVKVKTPDGTSATLHDKAGGTTDNLRETYDPVNAPDLASIVGTSQSGTWTLEVADTATADQGRIVRFGVELAF